MTIKELNQIDDSIRKHGDDFWNDEDEEPSTGLINTNRGWIVAELLEILAEDNLDLKIISK